MSFDSRISNGRLIRAVTGYANEDQISQVIQKALDDANLVSKFFINVVAPKGKYVKYSYVWVTTEEAFNFLVGFQDKGANSVKRLVTIPNPDYKEGSEIEEDPGWFTVPITKIKQVDNSTPKSNWFDNPISDTVKWGDYGVAVSPTINVYQESVVTLSKIAYTQQQVDMIKKVEPGYSCDPFCLKMDKGLFRDIRPRYLRSPDLKKSGTLGSSTGPNSLNSSTGSGLCSTDSSSNADKSSDESEESDDESDEIIYNKWIALNVPECITIGTILPVLKNVVTNPNAKGKMKFGTVEKYINYPHINIVKTKDKQGKSAHRVYVTFDPNSTDGIFGIHMYKQMKVSHNNHEHVLYFHHQLRRNREKDDS